MGKISQKAVILVLALFAACCCISGLAGCQKYYWDYDCSWVCDNPQIELYQGCGRGRMVIDGIAYGFITAQANDATDITFLSDSSSIQDESDRVIWVADTVLKDEKLYLTITLDNISDYCGKTVVLLQQAVD